MRGAGRHYERGRVTPSRVPAVQYEYSDGGWAGNGAAPAPAVLSPLSRTCSTHYSPASPGRCCDHCSVCSGLHRWQHSAVWKLPRNGVDKNIAIRLSPLTVVCSVPGTQTGYQVDICSSQSWHLARPGVSQAIPAPGPRLGSYRILESRHGAASPRRLVMVLVLGGVSARFVKSSQSQRRSLRPSLIEVLHLR